MAKDEKTFLGQGSPPRGRGKVLMQAHFQSTHGITPAWAGKRKCPLVSDVIFGDHPRVGGEKHTSCAPCPGRSGSPPRGRGKDKSGGEGGTLRRITPAWAGKRLKFLSVRFDSGDHPRVGGEKGGPHRAGHPPRGSPPRGRGKARHLSHGLLPCG